MQSFKLPNSTPLLGITVPFILSQSSLLDQLIELEPKVQFFFFCIGDANTQRNLVHIQIEFVQVFISEFQPQALSDIIRPLLGVIVPLPSISRLTYTLFVKGVSWTSPSVACSVHSPIYGYYDQRLACKLITEFKFSLASMILPL